MKFLLLLISILVLSISSHAQAPPQYFKYSATARNLSGQPIIASNISIQISIIQSTITGPIIYTENHILLTDSFGVFNAEVGNGLIQIGDFISINWSNDKYFIKIGLDVTGGNSFNDLGISQLLSVPFAIHSKTTSLITGGANGGIGGTGFMHYIGEYFGGGVIYHLWKDSIGIEHGLILDLQDIAYDTQWSDTAQYLTVIAPSLHNGMSNSLSIVQEFNNSCVASLCLNSTNGGFSDWYLPSIAEFKMIYKNYYYITKALSQISGAQQMETYGYWTSSEYNVYKAWIANPFLYRVEFRDKYENPSFFNTRAIRSF